jgi:hypothetical protein
MIRFLLSPLFPAVLAALLYLPLAASTAAANTLAVGRLSHRAEAVDLAIHAPADLNFKPIAQILALRQNAVMEHPNLLGGHYEPDAAVFGMLASQKPWWGLYGQYLFGPGVHSIEGPAKETIYFLNPYLLVSAEAHAAGIWDTRRLALAQYTLADFPFFWCPEGLRWYPRQAQAQVTYDISSYDRKLAAYRPYLRNNTDSLGTLVRAFSLIAYNARDLGYQFLYVVPEQSHNIMTRFASPVAVEIRQFLHCGGSCGYPGGCNNMSPYVSELDNLYLRGLPARAWILLWKKRPDHVRVPPDMTFIINFK